MSESQTEKPESPVEIERKIRGWTVKDLSEMADISIQTVYDSENGVLPHVPPAIVRALGRNIQEFEREYNAWQTACRKASPPLMIYTWDEMKGFLNSDIHPFETWYTRNGNTLVTFSELIKVSRRAIINYTNGSQSMPNIVRFALLEMQWCSRVFDGHGNPIVTQDFSAEQAVDMLTRLGEEYARKKSSDVIRRSLLANRGRTQIDGNGAEFIERD